MAQKAVQNKNELLTLQEMFRIVGDQLTARDVRVLRFMFSGIFTAEFLSQIHDGVSFLQALEKVDRIDESNFKNLENYLRIINRRDLYQFLGLRRRTPVKADPVTEYIEKTSVQTGNDPTPTKTCPKCEPKDQTLKRSNIPCQRSNSVCLGHSLAPSEANLLRKRNSAAWQTCDLEHTDPGPSTVHESPSGGHQMEVNDSRPGPSKRRCLVNDRPSCGVGDGSDPVSVAAQCVKHCVSKRSCSKKRRSYPGIPLRQSERLKKRYSTGGQKVNTVTNRIGAVNSQSTVRTNTKNTEDMRKKVTCDIRLRVRAEYCSHESALQGNIHSNKPELIEQQFEKFMQANTILKSRDLGSIICDIKFSDLTYLDAFWRDYINGSLLEALKGVFITETLKQAVGHEAIKLMVNVDEDDYESGRLALLKNLQHHR